SWSTSPENGSYKRESPAFAAPASERSAELALNERRQASTRVLGNSLLPGLDEDANQGLGSGRPDERSAAVAESGVELRDSVADGRAQLLRPDAHVLLRLRKPLEHGRRLAQPAAAERAAEEEGRHEAVACDVVVEVDDVARLLAAEDGVLAVERLEHVAVADRGGDDADRVLAHQRVEAVIRHLGDGDHVDAEVQREDGEDLVAVERLAALVDCEHTVAVAVEGDPEVVAPADDELLQGHRVGRAAADVDVVAGRVDAHRADLGP